MLQQHCFEEKGPLDKRLSWPHSQSEECGYEEKNSPVVEIETLPLQKLNYIPLKI